jgi:hypothetical protein
MVDTVGGERAAGKAEGAAVRQQHVQQAGAAGMRRMLRGIEAALCSVQYAQGHAERYEEIGEGDE